MSTARYDLGEVEHSYAGHDLKLTTRGDLTLSLPDLAQSSFKTFSGSLDDLISSKAWITSGASFELNFVLHLDGVAINDGNISDHTENLGLVFRNEEFWSGLCLTPSLQIREAPLDQPSLSLAVFLILRPSHGIDASQTQSCLPYNSEYLEPPAAVPSAFIKCINLYLTISHGSPTGTEALNLYGLTHHSEPMPQLPSPARLINFAEVTKFLDCSFKGIMFKSQRAVPAGFLLSSTANSTKTLDQVLPAVFSPGYLQAISQRRSLLSILAAIISGISLSTRSSSLQLKVQQLKDGSFDCYSSESPSRSSHPPSNGSCLKEVVEARLWSLLQHNLHTGSARSKFKSLRVKSKIFNTVDAGSLFDAEILQMDMGGDEAAHPSEVAPVPVVASYHIQPGHIIDSIEDQAEDLLDDELDKSEDRFYSLDESFTYFLKRKKSENVSFDNLEDDDCNVYEDQPDEDLFSGKIETEDSLCGFGGRVGKDESNEPLFWSDLEDSECLLDDICDHTSEDQYDEDLFWGDLEDQEDLPLNAHASDLASCGLQDKTSNDELLDDAQTSVSSLDDENLELEDILLEDADVLYVDRCQGDLAQASEMLLEI